MKKLTTILALCWAILFSGCAFQPQTDPSQYSRQLMATLSGNGKYVDMMNASMNAKNYPKAEAIIKNWAGQLDKSLGEVAQIQPLEHDPGLKQAVEKVLEAYKHVAIYEYQRLIDLRREQLRGNDAVEPQIQAMVNRINTSLETIPQDIVRARKAFDERFGKP